MIRTTANRNRRRWRRRLAMLAWAATAGAAAETAPLITGELGFPELPQAEGGLTVTWYGVTTLLFDDGDTKVMIDGFFSRPQPPPIDELANDPSAWVRFRVAPDADQIERMIKQAGLKELAAITPVHSHYDHAMDLGVIAKRTGAVVLGSESTANIARGADVPESQIRTVTEQGEFRFGQFTVRLIRSTHAPLVDGGPPIPGSIDAPLRPPASLLDWKEGGSYTILISHPAGTALVQGSAGYVKDALDGVSANVVLLGIGGLDTLGARHSRNYYAEIVTAVGAKCVLPIHWDDFFLPLGEIKLDGDPIMLGWLQELADADGATLATLPYGAAVNPFDSLCGLPPSRSTETATGPPS
ncbi:MAG: MBL fold metallo-hydrolase [Gammaproteobacteria bacterium]|nr:MBL fold metallo-hydrolase [Gammaproteobacteria bacterium]MYK81857.1 MBL fold metallo-hydrolase [Gammaproteobacteria bacterium]